MDQFQNALAILTKKIKNASLFKEEVSSVIEKTLGIPLSKDAIVIKNNSVFVHVSPTIKTALFLKKKKLLQQLEKYKVYIIG